MGAEAPTKIANVLAGLESGAIAPIQIVARRRWPARLFSSRSPAARVALAVERAGRKSSANLLNSEMRNGAERQAVRVTTASRRHAGRSLRRLGQVRPGSPPQGVCNFKQKTASLIR